MAAPRITQLPTERLVLREFTRDDVDDLVALDGDPRVMRYIGDGSVGTRGTVRGRASSALLARYAEGTGLGLWHATRRDDGTFVGWVSLKPCGDSTDIEVGYRLMHDAWGRGYATELARAMLRRGFDDVGLDRIIGVTHPDNHVSQRVLAKVGMRDEGWGRYYGRDLRLFAIRRCAVASRGRPLSAMPSVRGALETSGLVPVDARVLLAHVLGCDRAWLIAHAGDALSRDAAQAFFALAKRRRDGEPVAYLTGRREFWGLDLAVTPAVLIPRPETETLVEVALARLPVDRGVRVLDLGTGSGAIALALARERPQAEVVATDVSPEALDVARGNAARLAIGNVAFLRSDWYAGVPAGSL